MMPSLHSARPTESLRLADERLPELSELQPPQKDGVIKIASDVEKPHTQQSREENPSYFAPENPTNRELAKERWYTRAAWASIAVDYSAGLFSIACANTEVVTSATTRGLLMDAVFSYWALRNSELRRFILEGSVLPTPAHADKFVRSLFGLGAACNFAASLSSGGMSAYMLLQNEYSAAAITAASALGSLHIGCAWVRRIRFFGSIDAQ